MTINELKEHAVKIVNPRLNSYVYIITFVHDKPYSITRDKVYMKNKEAFITENMMYDDYIPEYREECKFNEYGKRWCKTFKEAKAIVKENEKRINNYYSDKHYDFKIEKCDKNIWNIETYVARSV